MKINYISPSIEVLETSMESGVCTTASGTEGFENIDGVWDSAATSN